MGEQHTHSVTPQQRPPTAIEVLRKDLATDYLKTVTNYYRGNEQEALAFMTSAIEYVRRVPDLLNCRRDTLLTSLVTAAQFRFMPSGVGGEAYIIPYKNEAKFQLGYQGVVTLLYRTNKIKAISANIIYANDEFDYAEGLEAHLVHKPAMFGKPKGDPIGVYTVAQMAGGARTFKVMDKDAVMAIKAISKAKNSDKSPWNSDLDPELWMWKKTCLLQHAKLLPKTQDLRQAMEADFEGEGVDKPPRDAGGPAVPKAFHDPELLGTRSDKTFQDEVVSDPPAESDPEKCRAGLHHSDYVDENGKCSECFKEKE